jgi:hypothetical protein
MAMETRGSAPEPGRSTAAGHCDAGRRAPVDMARVAAAVLPPVLGRVAGHALYWAVATHDGFDYLPEGITWLALDPNPVLGGHQTARAA